MQSLCTRMNLAQDSAVVFNTLGFSRTDMVQLDAKENLVPVDADGAPLPCQRTESGKLLFLAKDVPAKGFKAFCLQHGSLPAAHAAEITDNRVETPFFIVEFDTNYNILRLLHKPSGRAVAPEGQLLNRLIAFEDRPNVYEAWDVKSYYDEKFTYIDAVEYAQVIESGAVRTVLRVKRPFRSSVILQNYISFNSRKEYEE